MNDIHPPTSADRSALPPARLAPPGALKLIEGASYQAHLHNLGVLLRQAQHDYAAGELALASATATRARAANDAAAAGRMAAALRHRDFGFEHTLHMIGLQESLAVQAMHARTTERGARGPGHQRTGDRGVRRRRGRVSP